MNMSILPFTRPTLGDEEQQAVNEVLASGWLTTGPKVEALEQALSAAAVSAPRRCYESVGGALAGARCEALPGDRILITGSFMTVAEALEHPTLRSAELV